MRMRASSFISLKNGLKLNIIGCKSNFGCRLAGNTISGNTDSLRFFNNNSGNISYFPVDKLRRILNGNPTCVLRVLNLEMNPQLSSDKHIRVGSKGSLCINNHGKDCSEFGPGRWFNYENDTHGDMLDLVAIERKIPKDKIINYIVDNILPDLEEVDDKEAPECSASSQFSKSPSEDFVSKLIPELRPIAGTVVERYLLRRGISKVDTPNIRCHPRLCTTDKLGKNLIPNLPGMVAIASNPKSDRVNVQVTYLDSQTCMKHPDVSVQKRTFGSFSSRSGHTHCCQLSGEKIGSDEATTFLVEGVETGLSLYQAFSDEHIIASLGKSNFSRVDHELLNRKVVLVLDNDGVDYRQDKVLRRTFKMLLENGKLVFVVHPPLLKGATKTDMNDILVHEGEEVVHRTVVEHLKKIVP